MKFYLESFSARCDRMRKWHKWFAWYPARVDRHHYVWLEYVMRSREWDGYSGIWRDSYEEIK